ncbi:MAG: hypothetical protein ACTSU4_00465 [Promethearchaeota archaeon]
MDTGKSMAPDNEHDPIVLRGAVNVQYPFMVPSNFEDGGGGLASWPDKM